MKTLHEDGEVAIGIESRASLQDELELDDRILVINVAIKVPEMGFDDRFRSILRTTLDDHPDDEFDVVEVNLSALERMNSTGIQALINTPHSMAIPRATTNERLRLVGVSAGVREVIEATLESMAGRMVEFVDSE